MIEIRVEKRLPGFTLAVSLLTEGGITVFFGKSGAGKTLTLRAIAGLLRPDCGVIRIGGRTVYDHEHRINLPARERRIGY
ncbi:MAG: ATP-binding cassette domain-containing protein, partial [Deltaproteobacteria bacterium]|nr:ATP-binding cassette domain-containing protein [Deltaproteobacteria bacterium]